uniref:UDENN FNIP1/2-type domain-containing protein n=1 Tax=Heterorhabditis bacteriophora TaxID=37862 RepID=A0A1I7XRV2_HETBA
MSFIRTIFPATKRRKTAGDMTTFAQPQMPLSGRGTAVEQRPSGLPSIPVQTPRSQVFDSLCCTRDRKLNPDMLRMVLVEADQRVLFDSETIVPVSQRIIPGAQISSCRKFQVSLIITFFKNLPFLSPYIYREVRGATESLASSDSESQYVNTIRSLDGLTKGAISSTAPPEAFTRVGKNTFFIFFTTLMIIIGTTVRWKSRSRLSSCGSQTDDENGRQVGLGLMLHSQEKNFFFQHIPLVEAELSRLETRVTNAASHPPTFINNVSQAWQEFCESVCRLHNTPRLRHPVWLSLLERDHNENVVASDFCCQLARLVEKLDTKHTRFFLSNVISTVLMHHMSWVASVAPPLHAPTQMSLRDRNPLVGSILNDEAPYMPYNAHMAQYLEISGSVGSTHRIAKTVVCGADSDLIAAILQVLSYFIRCSAIHHKEDERCAQLPMAQSFSPCAATPESAASPPSETHLDITFSPDKASEEDAFSSCSLESLTSVAGPSRDRRNSIDVNVESHADGLGRSLLAGPSFDYSSHFVLSGLINNGGSNITEAFSKMLDDVRCEDSACHRAAASSLSSSQSSSSICDAVQLPDNVIILANTNEWSVKVVSGGSPTPTQLSPERVRSIVGCDHSDLRLILNVASVYWPPVLASVL